MPSASHYLTTRKASRILIVGDPGAGKSSACAHLANSPLISRLFWADLDDNLRGPFRQLPPEALAKIHVETLKDQVKFNTNQFPIVPGVPTAFPALTRLLNEWVDSETGENFGHPEDWTSEDVLVLDGISGMSAAAMFYTLYGNRRMGQQREIKDWSNCFDRVEGIIASLNAGPPHRLPCHVIMTAHLARLTPENAVGGPSAQVDGSREHTRGGMAPPENFWMRYPAGTLGQKLPPRLGGMVECVIQAKRVGEGLMAQYILKTAPDSDVDVKLPLKQAEINALGGIEVPNTKLIDIIEKSCQIGE